jgi:hypothetical protein
MVAKTQQPVLSGQAVIVGKGNDLAARHGESAVLRGGQAWAGLGQIARRQNEAAAQAVEG